MAATKSTAARKSTRATRARVAKTPAASASLPKSVLEAFADMREKSQEFRLAGLGMLSNVRKQNEERMADWVKEGRRVEPKVRQAVEQWKETLQSRMDVRNFKLPKLDLSRFRSADRQDV